MTLHSGNTSITSSVQTSPMVVSNNMPLGFTLIQNKKKDLELNIPNPSTNPTKNLVIYHI